MKMSRIFLFLTSVIFLSTQVNAGLKTHKRLLIRSPSEDSEEDAGIGLDELKNLQNARVDDSTETPIKKSEAVPVARPGELYLPADYNKLEIPKIKFAGLSIELTISVYIHLGIWSIVKIDEANEEITVEMDLIVDWMDPALLSMSGSGGDPPVMTDDSEENSGEPKSDFDPLTFRKAQKTLDPVFLKQIWKPDIYIENLIQVKQAVLMSQPSRLKFGKSGLITYTTRVTVKLKCELNFEYYPADTQTCDVLLRSYSYTSSQLELIWRRPVGVYLKDPSDDSFDLAVGSIRRFQYVTKIDRKINETYEALQFTISARRRLSYHLLQTYIPSMLYMAITWVCFMIPARMIEARVAICMTVLLTLTAMFASVRESTPEVSYVKAIDLWMVACIVFVFLTLLEFAVLLWTESARHDEEEQRKRLQTENEIPAPAGSGLSPRPKNDDKKDTKLSRPSPRPKPSTGQKLRKRILTQTTTAITFIEDYSFILILAIFIAFISLYWSWLLQNSGYFKWSVDRAHNAVDVEVSQESIVYFDPFQAHDDVD